MEFKTLTEASAAYADLEKSGEALLTEASDKIEALESSATETKDIMSSASEKIEGLEGDVKSLESEKTDLETKNAELESNKLEVQAEAARIAAASGIPPVEGSEGESENVSSYEDFKAMNQVDRHEFIKEGGKIAK